MEEIEAQFKSEWVLIANPETDKYNRVIEGTVVFHRADRDEKRRMPIFWLNVAAQFIAGLRFTLANSPKA